MVLPKTLCLLSRKIIVPLIWCCLLLGPVLSHAQKESPPPDSNHVDVYDGTWSIRAYGIIKSHGLRMENNTDGLIRYLPDNIFGAGLGISYKFIVLDLGLTLGGDQNLSNRLDIQGSVFLKKNIIDYYLQAYRGFALIEPAPGDSFPSFRQDIRTLAFGANFYHAFNGDDLAFRSTTVGDVRQLASAGSFVLGGFASFYLLKADSSMVPEGYGRFGKEAQFQNLHLNSVGVAGGYTYFWSLPSRFGIFASLVPGIGVNGGDLQSDEWYSPPLAPVFKVLVGGGINYSHPRFYSLLSISYDSYWINLGNQNRFFYNLTKVKFSIGYRFRYKQKK